MRTAREAKREASDGHVTVFGKGSSVLRLDPTFAEELGLRDGQELGIPQSLVTELTRCANAAQTKADSTHDPMAHAGAAEAADAYRHAAKLVRQAREGK